MDDRKPAKPFESPAPKKHRLLKVFAALMLMAAALVAGLPWLLGTPPARAFVVARINARLAPGSIRLDGLRVSWYGPTVLDGVALVDPRGKTVLAARRVTLDRSVPGLIASRPNYGTITVEDATIDVERKADGSVDLREALAAFLPTGPASTSAPAPPVANPATVPAAPEPPSPVAVHLVLKGGTVKVAAPELVEPLEASTLEGSMTMAPGKPIEVELALGGEGRSLEVRSTIEPGATTDRVLSVVGKDWPVHVRQGGVEAKGRFDGNLEAKEAQGLWSAKGDAALVGFEAAGKALLGDRLILDRVVAACEVGQSSTGWTITRLDVTSPVGSLQGGGTIPSTDGKPAQVHGKVDLAALAKMLPHAMRLRDGLTLEKGTATIRLDVSRTADVDRAELSASLDDFQGTEAGRAIRPRQPVFLAGQATRSAGKVSVESVEVKAAGVDVKGSGDLDAGVKLSGTVDLVELKEQLRDFLDLGVYDFSGRGRLAADYHHEKDSYKGRVAAEFVELKVVGLTAEPFARDRVRLDGSATGPTRADGVPNDWQTARLDLKAGDLKLDVQATSTEKSATLVAAFETLVSSPVAGRFDAKAKFRKVGTLVDISELVAGITPTDPQAASGAVALAVLGRFDTASGEGTFRPIPGYKVGAFGLAPEGLKLSGVGKAGAPMKADAALVGDLAMLDRLLSSWSGSALKGWGGLWASRLDVARSALGQLDVEGDVSVPDLTMTTSKGPVALTIKGGYAPESDRVSVDSARLSTRFGKLGLVAGLVELQGRRMVDVKGTFEPDWAAIDPIVASSVEETARVRATVRPFHVSGSLQGDSTAQILGQLSGEAGLDISMAEAFGVTLGEAPVVLKFGQGAAKFDPIVSTMNGGKVVITGDLGMDDDLGVILRVGPTRIDDAAINEAVSNSLLAYVAPVMAKSSSVSGKVTVAVTRASVPITSKGPLTLDGAMAFQQVVFKPGSLAAELNSITGQAMKDIKLDEVMTIKIADGRVTQNGLSIPVGGNGLKVAIDGSVGLDKTLDLQAKVPLSSKALGLDSSFDKIASGQVVTLPIGGTLSRPAIDRNALRVAIRDAVKGVGEKQIKAEAGRFLDRIAGPGQGSGEPRSKPAGRNPLGDLEGLGREILEGKKP